CRCLFSMIPLRPALSRTDSGDEVGRKSSRSTGLRDLANGFHAARPCFKALPFLVSQSPEVVAPGDQFGIRSQQEQSIRVEGGREPSAGRFCLLGLLLVPARIIPPEDLEVSPLLVGGLGVHDAGDDIVCESTKASVGADGRPLLADVRQGSWRQILSTSRLPGLPDAFYVYCADQPSVGAESHGPGPVSVSLQGKYFLSGLYFPHLYRPVLAGAGEVHAVGAEGHGGHVSFLPLQGEGLLPGPRVPHLRRPVSACAGETCAVGAESHSPDPVG